MSTADVQIPRLPDEGARAYAARLSYITMGPARSLAKVRGQSEGKAGVPRRMSTLEKWSSRYGWADSARLYDDTIAGLVIQQAADEYRRNLEAHRKRAGEISAGLHTVAVQLLNKLNEALGQLHEIRGEDGHLYTLHNIELNANTFAVAARALTLSLDIEAHSLGIFRLMATLTEADDSA
jgi:hypothetical protein